MNSPTYLTAFAASAEVLPLSTGAASSIALPAAADPTYQPRHRRRARLLNWLRVAADLSIGISDLRLCMDGSNANELTEIVRKRCSAVREVLKRARYNERRRGRSVEC